ncbi:unnamed protein product [Ostreobium quekettii]|uniref:Uncharacterized protein n=1 Tax=Ostreobium quekettii TaxID=121088 RepID=A0A8S1J918_9CHLO|nr:unnamed protein product [Ostreobium quekettii]
MAEQSLQGIKRVVDEGAHYEAQQMYKTVHHRYHTKGMLEDSYKILEEGAVLQLATGHLTCGVELGLMLIEAYEKDEVGLTEEACRRVDHMLDGLPEPPTCSSEGSIDGNCKGTEGSKVDEALRLLTAAIKWGHKQGAGAWERRLHDRAARFVWGWQGWSRLALVSAHYAQGSDWQGFASALATCARMGEPCEEDLFVARAVLQVLAWARVDQLADRVSSAQSLLTEYQEDRLLPETPLMHCMQLMIQALNKNSATLFQMLLNKYDASLSRDPSLSHLLQKVEQVFFGAQQTNGFGGMLGGLMQMLAGGAPCS